MLQPQIIAFNVPESGHVHIMPQEIVLLQRAIPSILHACHESRAIGLAYYSAGYKISMHHSTHDEIAPAPNSYLYWNPEYDTILLLFGSEELAHVSQMGMTKTIFDERTRIMAASQTVWRVSPAWLDRMPALKRIIAIWARDEQVVRLNRHLRGTNGTDDVVWKRIQASWLTEFQEGFAERRARRRRVAQADSGGTSKSELEEKPIQVMIIEDDPRNAHDRLSSSWS